MSEKQDRPDENAASQDTEPSDETVDEPPAEHELPGLVDDLEQEVVEERRSKGVPGNAADRAETTQIESEDQA